MNEKISKYQDGVGFGRIDHKGVVQLRWVRRTWGYILASMALKY